MATDRSGWRSLGPAKLAGLAVGTALVVGVVLVASWGDGADEDGDASQGAAQVETDTGAGGEPASRSTPEATEVVQSSREGVTSADEEGQAGPATATPAAATEPAEVSIVAVSRIVTEAAPALFTLTRAGEAGTALTVAVGMAESGSMLAGDGRETVTFAAGERRTTLSVELADDSVVEGTSRVSATITAGSGYVVSAQGGSAHVYVADNDRVFLLPGPGERSTRPFRRGGGGPVGRQGDAGAALRGVRDEPR